MAIFRIEKTADYTTMSNRHLTANRCTAILTDTDITLINSQDMKM